MTELDAVWIEDVFDESPRLTYRARSGDTLSSYHTLEIFEEKDETSPGLILHNASPSPRSSSGQSPKENGLDEVDGMFIKCICS